VSPPNDTVVSPTSEDSPRRPWGEPGPTTLPALDGLRALAVLAVLLTHVGFQTGRNNDGQLGAVLSRLDIGVTLFFLLSGFLLYRPYVTAHLTARPGPRLGAYLRNRALRILPAYLVFVVVVVPLLSPERTDVRELLRQLFLLQTATAGNLLPGMTQTWSLVVEAGFYLALPFLAWVVRPRRPRSPDRQLRAEGLLLLGLTVVALGWRVAVHAGGLGDERITTIWLPGYLDWFALGMGLAVLRTWCDVTGRGRVVDELAAAWPTWLLIGGLLFWLSTGPLAGPRGLEPPTTWEALSRHLLYGLAATCLLVPVVLGRNGGRSGWERLLSSRPARHLGRISYGVFLWHLLALDLVFRLPGLDPFEGRALLVLALTLPLSIAMAQVSLVVVEEPALRRKRPASVR
jgi:peptidoglycan/LPS O-acetylase OafA/YrhL